MTSGTRVSVAGQQVDPGVLWHALSAYSASHYHVLRWYDLADRGPVTPIAEIDLEALGRLHFTGTGLTVQQGAELLDVATKPLLALVPPESTLVQADPASDGNLYDFAEAAHRAYLSVDRRFGPTLVSATLALLRPHLFPILTAPIRMLYEGPAELAWCDSQKAPILTPNLLAGYS
jgi:hypothetical protein